jgi:CBS domain-containing protein
MRVRDLELKRLLAVEPDTPLSEIARRMRLEDADSVVVISRGRLVGIVTERDMVGAIADGIDPQQADAEVVMAAEPSTVEADEDVYVVAMKMMRLGVRHFPVVDEEGKPIGIVAARNRVRGRDRES